MGKRAKTKTEGLIIRNGKLYVDLRFCDRNRVFTGDVDTTENRTKWLNNLDEMRVEHASGRLTDLRFGYYFENRDLTGITFAQLVVKWKEHLPFYRKNGGGKLSPSTMRYYKVYADVSWSRAFSERRGGVDVSMSLKQITAEMIQDWIEEDMVDLKAKTISNYCSALKLIFAYAVRKGYVQRDRNPTLGISASARYGKLDPNKVLPLEKVQPMLDAIRAAAEEMYCNWLAVNPEPNKLAGEVYYNYFDFAVSTGLRPGEQIALRVADVDLDQKTVHVCKGRVLGEDRESTKTGESRMVNLNPRALAAVERQLKIVGTEPDAHLFINVSGEAFHDLQMPRRVYKIADLAVFGPRKKLDGKLEKRRSLYATRHTSVTLNMMMGRRGDWIAQQHGHSEQVMRAVYAHWVRFEDDDGEKMNPAIARIRTFFGLPVRDTMLTEHRLLKQVEELQRQLAEARAGQTYERRSA